MLVIEFRKYQKDILDRFEEYRTNNKRRFHLVSPPGSGKTLLGLEMAARLGLPAVVFVPTLAIQAQWLEAVRTHAVDFNASSDPLSTARILVLTYQSISVKKANTNELHHNSRALIELVSQRGILIFDECHHLTKEWARILNDVVLKGGWLIALTATPPHDHDAVEQETYYKLLGEVSAEADLPPIIKEGWLAPFQDLVYLVSPTDQEIAQVENMLQPWRTLMKDLRETRCIPSLGIWSERCLEDYRLPNGESLGFERLNRKKPALALALCRIVLHYGMELPLSICPSPEMEEPPDFRDLLQALEDYLYNCLLPLSKSTEDIEASTEAASLLLRCDHALDALGYSRGPRAIRAGRETVQAILGTSYGKILAVKPIIEREMRHLGDDFRCLVLCDTESIKERNGTGAIELLDFLTDDPETDLCNPVLLTGKTVLVDDDILELFLAAARDFARARNVDVALTTVERSGFFEIGSNSSDWSTHLYVPFISSIFERGLTRCLISTRAMLGEGWNSISLNTLIDLTVSSSFAFVNQMRGRTLRLDPARPLKAANNWDLVTVFPDNEQGYGDLERVRNKYQRFFGMSTHGTIEKGAGHLHPFLEGHSPQFLYEQRHAINTEMLDRSECRLDVYHRWGVGKPYKNIFFTLLDIEVDKNYESFPEITPRSYLAGPIFFVIKQLSLKLSVASFFKAILSRQLRVRIGPDTLSLVRSLVHVLVRCGLVCGLLPSKTKSRDIEIRSSGNGSLRVGAKTSELSAFISTALKDLLAPPAREKYTLLAWPLMTPSQTKVLFANLSKEHETQKEREYVSNRGDVLRRVEELIMSGREDIPGRIGFPVPKAFSDKREYAECFKSLWVKTIGPAVLTGGRFSDSDTVLLPVLHKKPLPLIAIQRQIWQ